MSAAPTLSLIVGLGNPGARFQNTWHNLGFMVLDAWAAKEKLSFKPGRGDYYYLKHRRSGEEVLFLKPTPFMNLSGLPVAKIARRLKLQPENILVICDDVALPWGTIRLRKSGSDGGHKGLASIIAEVDSQDLPRMRLGIETGSWSGELSDYVLTPIPEQLYPDVKKVLQISIEALDCLLHQGLAKAMNRYNRNFLSEAEPPKVP